MIVIIGLHASDLLFALVLSAHLTLYQGLVRLAALEEILVLPRVDHSSGLNHRNLIRTSHGGEAVCDDDDGAPRAGPINGVLHKALGLGVEGGGRFVQ